MSFTVKDHFNTQNAKVIVLDVQNTSTWEGTILVFPGHH